jgi:protein-S-isoprenylcysteine O-methyltransferase Ste14
VLVEPGRALVLGHQENVGWFDIWAFVVEPVDQDTTRLIHRSRTAVDQTWVKIIEPGMFVMERGMMRGVRARAEGWTLDSSREDPYRWAYLALIIGYFLVRVIYQGRGRQGNTVSVSEGAGLQAALLGLASLASIPAALYAFSEAIDFAHLPLPGILRILGGLLFLGGDLLFYAAHRALKKNWSAQVEIQAGHTLVTDGPYRRVRHPMYTALFLIGAGMLLLSASWLAGGPFLLAFTLLYLTRVEAEERLLRAHFGAAYEAYMQRTGRLLPKL